MYYGGPWLATTAAKQRKSHKDTAKLYFWTKESEQKQGMLPKDYSQRLAWVALWRKCRE